jgi:dTDP-4-amino-4,6-dideoxygalactose transaminase
MSERKIIHLCLAKMSEEGWEKRYIQEAFETNWVAPLGANVNAFEEELKRFLGGEREVVCLSSGTAAVHLALLLAGVGPGDEVLVQSFTFCASANPVIYLGATPVFVDSEKETWNMDPDLLEQAIRDRIAKTGRKPKAIVPVTLYGMPYQVDRILEIAKRYEIPLVEDTAESLGSCYRGHNMGTFGQFGVLSFNGNKIITTSGGGALICHDAESKRKALWYATQAREGFPFYHHEGIGYNYRLSNISAGIGRGQMHVLKENIAHHKHVQKLYEELLADVSGIKVHTQPDTGEFDSNYWLCTITLDSSLKIAGQEKAYADAPRVDCQPNDNVEALRVVMDAAGIEARPVWKPMHLQPVFAGAPAYVNGVSEAIFRVGICLPTGPYVTDDDVRYIVETIKSAIIK